jgi:hypothetical protein
MERLKNMQRHPIPYYFKSIANKAFVKKYLTGGLHDTRNTIMTIGLFAFQKFRESRSFGIIIIISKNCTLPLSARDGQADKV